MTLDPEVAVGLENLPPSLDASRGIAAFHLTDAQRAWPDRAASDLIVVDQRVPGLSGRPVVPLRTYHRKDSAGPAGRLAVLVLHGGGFISGSPAAADETLQDIARRWDAVVAAPTYRLAPQHPYPSAFEDCLASLHWLADSDHGIDPDRLVVFGVSSGACLTAALTLHVRDHGGPRIAAQVLGFPVLDDRLSTVSSKQVDDIRVWNRGMADLSWRAYLGSLADGDDIPITAVPARATDLSRLPRATITVNDHDPLRDEGIAYAQRLMQAGVSTELHTFPGTFHGSMGVVPDAAVSRREADALSSAIGRV